MTAEKPLLICLMGPTASGKTDLAIALAGELDCELVSVDSALVYRGLDIGSAKPDYPHHLVDIRDPSEAYSAADFAAGAQLKTFIRSSKNVGSQVTQQRFNVARRDCRCNRSCGVWLVYTWTYVRIPNCCCQRRTNRRDDDLGRYRGSL